MKTFFITTIAFLALALACNAQWTTSGTSIIPLPANLGYNVGIGTANPVSTALLHIQNNTNGPTVSTVVNNDPGANAKASMIVGSVPGTGGTGGTFGSLEYLGAGQLLTGLLGPDRTMLRGSGAGGLFITAENTGGVISFATGGPSIANQRMLINSTGNVGISTTVPFSKLQVGSPGGSTTVSLSNDANIFGAYSAARGNLNIGTTDVAATDKGGMMTFSGGTGQVSDPYYFAGIRGAKEAGGTYKGYLAFYTVPSTSILTEGMRITSVGNVGIGTTNPDQKLTVNGAIHSTSVLVDTNVPTPDYVFKSDYKLPTLSEIKAYTDKNHHLPGIPAAAEMEKNGINLGEMNMALLKKVEELTLYLMEKDNAEREQKEINKTQSAELKLQQKQINKLKKSLDSMNHKKSK